jgi:hypothetical protein
LTLQRPGQSVLHAKNAAKLCCPHCRCFYR